MGRLIFFEPNCAGLDKRRDLTTTALTQSPEKQNGMKPAARVGREFMQECMHNTGDSPNQLTSTRVPKIKNKHETKPAKNIPEGAVQRHSYCYDHT